jgi:hypothetical protein
MELPNDLKRFNPKDIWDMLANHHSISGTGDLSPLQWEIFGALRERYLVSGGQTGEPVTTFSTVLTDAGRELMEKLAGELGKR